MFCSGLRTGLARQTEITMKRVENEFKRMMFGASVKSHHLNIRPIARASFYAGALAMYKMLILDVPELSVFKEILVELDEYTTEVISRAERDDA